MGHCQSIGMTVWSSYPKYMGFRRSWVRQVEYKRCFTFVCKRTTGLSEDKGSLLGHYLPILLGVTVGTRLATEAYSLGFFAPSRNPHTFLFRLYSTVPI